MRMKLLKHELEKVRGAAINEMRNSNIYDGNLIADNLHTCLDLDEAADSIAFAVVHALGIDIVTDTVEGVFHAETAEVICADRNCFYIDLDSAYDESEVTIDIIVED